MRDVPARAVQGRITDKEDASPHEPWPEILIAAKSMRIGGQKNIKLISMPQPFVPGKVSVIAKYREALSERASRVSPVCVVRRGII